MSRRPSFDFGRRWTDLAAIFQADFLPRLIWRLQNLGRRAWRHWGMVGLLLPTCALLALSAWHLEARQARVLAAAQAAADLTRTKSAAARVPLDVLARVDDRARLKAFEAILLPPDELPMVVQYLLDAADERGLALVRGEYRPQEDHQGGFLRYRMTLPVQGDAASIQHFVRSALQRHPALALESVEFTRERIDSGEVQAKIQWVVLARLSGGKTTP